MNVRSIAMWCCAVLFAASLCVAAWFLAVPDHGFGLILSAPAALFLLVFVPVGLGLATFTLALSRHHRQPRLDREKSPDGGAG